MQLHYQTVHFNYSKEIVALNKHHKLNDKYVCSNLFKLPIDVSCTCVVLGT